LSINACYFMDCIFEWNNDFLYSTDLPYIGIYMTNLKGVNIGGTTFINSITNNLCPNKRGIGIKAIDAKFIVSHSGNTIIEDLDPNDEIVCPTNGYNGMAGATCSFQNLSL